MSNQFLDASLRDLVYLHNSTRIGMRWVFSCSRSRRMVVRPSMRGILKRIGRHGTTGGRARMCYLSGDETDLKRADRSRNWLKLMGLMRIRSASSSRVSAMRGSAVATITRVPASRTSARI